MTRDEAKKIVMRVRNLYISQARQYTETDWQTMIDVWYEQFKAETYDDVYKALTMYVNNGKQYIPNVADIINEMINIDEPETAKLFKRLKKECDIIANGIEHVVLDDLGGVVKDPNSPTGWRYIVPEAHVTTKYTQADFANLPMELQIYAEDIEGLRKLNDEILSNERFAYKRFKDHLTYIRNEMKERVK